MWLSNLPFLRRKTQTLTAVVQPSGIYFIAQSQLEWPKFVEVTDSWQDSLYSTCSQHGKPGLKIDLILDARHFQTYQIDKPNIPEQEWLSAIPFLLKDVMPEKPADVMVGAMVLPTNDAKLQVFVTSKHMLTQINQKLADHKMSLASVSVEDEYWPELVDDVEQFIFLHRETKGHFKVAAFINGVPIFQRSIRSVGAPLTGVAASMLQIDGIALELQRSIDYLSSQHRGSPLHQLRVCCDDEDLDELVKELDERLSVRVTRLDSEADTCIETLTKAINKHVPTINLLPKISKPKAQPLRFNLVATSWLLTAVVLASTWAWLERGNQKMTSQLAVLNQQQAALNTELAELQRQLQLRVPSAEKQNAIARLEVEIASKKTALAAVANFEREQPQAYSKTMESLVTINHSDIALQRISMNKTDFDVVGLARQPSAIPNWVNRFKQELSLIGRAFESMSIESLDSGVSQFELRTERDSQ